MPVQIIGRKIKLDDEVCVMRDGEPYAFPRNISPLQTSTAISPGVYALVNQGTFPCFESDSAISMMQSLGGNNRVDAHREAFRRNLKIPTIQIFLPHYTDVNEALEHRAVLYNASGKVIPDRKLKGYARTLNSKCFVHLNAEFPGEQESGTGFLGLDLAVITGFDSEGNPVISRSPLEDCLEQSCWAELESSNSQGLPTRESKIERYIPGKVIYFWHPMKGTAAGCDANSDRVYLNCVRNPDYSNSALGVFLCAEGTQKN